MGGLFLYELLLNYYLILYIVKKIISKQHYIV
nr:MAG TPA: hypothetical protein [Caudoviricetes sp.]